MNWEAASATADIVAAVGVIITLSYLAIQIRQNSKSVKASAAQSVIQSLADAYSATAASPELCHIIVVGAKDMDSLDEFQKAQLYMWLTSWYRLVEQAYLHYMMGNIPETTWNGQLAHLKSALSTSAMAAFWETRKGIYSQEFREFVDRLDISDATTVDEMFSSFSHEQSTA